MNIVHSYKHFKDHFDRNNNYNSSRIKYKLIELAKGFVFVPADKAVDKSQYC